MSQLTSVFPPATAHRTLTELSASRIACKYFKDIEIDASEEDLPVEWVKKQRSNGSVYYFNVMTGAKLARSPNDLGGDGADGGDPAPSRESVMSRIFRVRSWRGISSTPER